jgi:hypothetical protein
VSEDDVTSTTFPKTYEIEGVHFWSIHKTNFLGYLIQGTFDSIGRQFGCDASFRMFCVICLCVWITIIIVVDMVTHNNRFKGVMVCCLCAISFSTYDKTTNACLISCDNKVDQEKWGYD